MKISPGGRVREGPWRGGLLLAREGVLERLEHSNSLEVCIFALIFQCWSQQVLTVLRESAEVSTVDKHIIQISLGLEYFLCSASHIAIQRLQVINVCHIHIELGTAFSIQVHRERVGGEEARAVHCVGREGASEVREAKEGGEGGRGREGGREGGR